MVVSLVPIRRSWEIALKGRDRACPEDGEKAVENLGQFMEGRSTRLGAYAATPPPRLKGEIGSAGLHPKT